MSGKVRTAVERADIDPGTLLTADRKVETEWSVSGPLRCRNGKRTADVDQEWHVLKKVNSD